MTKRTCTSSDGALVAYDSQGTGDAILLLHGGFVQDREVWTERAWLPRLASHHRVLSVDLRGHGESSHPSDPASYAFAHLAADLRAVLDAEELERVAVVGYSLGALVALRFAVHEPRVEQLVMIGAAFGPAIPGAMQAQVLARLAEVESARATDTPLALSPLEEQFVRRADFDVVRAAYTALPSWPEVDPADLCCPTLFIAGTENPWSMASLEQYGARLSKSGVEVALIEGATHEAELDSDNNALARTETFLATGGAARKR